MLSTKSLFLLSNYQLVRNTMDKTKLLIAGVLVAIVASAIALVSTKTVVVNQTQPQQTYGAVSGPDMPFQYISVGGVARYYYSYPLATGTTSPCSIQSPAARNPPRIKPKNKGRTFR